MACTNPDIEKYLHFIEGKKEYKSGDFKNWHLIYRTGFKEKANPIEFPSVLTSYSVCWSRLIKPKHVLKTVLAGNPALGNEVYFGKIKLIKEVKIDSECMEGVYKGIHTITTELTHKPETCNYSHAEVLIKHCFDNNGVRQQLLLRYEDWTKANISKSGKHAKELRAGYKATMGTILNNPINEKIPWYIKFLNSRKVISILLFFRINLKTM